MKLLIKQLTAVNFKGTKSLIIDFTQGITNIFGDNATGKTTIFDAFVWLFFGKESTDRKDFNIKNTVDTSMNRQEHEVSAVIEANGSDITIKRVFKEKWTKKRGSEIAEYSGNETMFMWDDVPVNQQEFNKRVSSLIEEKLFKLITNPAYFNSLKWQERRQIIFDMAGEVTNESVAGGNKKFLDILSNLTNGKTMEDYKRQLATQRKKIKDELDQIPTRIDEVLKNLPQIADGLLISKEIESKKSKIKLIDTQMADRSNSMNGIYEKVREHQQQVHAVNSTIDSIRNKLIQEINATEQNKSSERNQIVREINFKKQEIKQIESQRDRRQDEITSINNQISAKRGEWVSVNANRERVSAEKLVFDDHAFTCPTCARLFDDDDIVTKKEELLQKFSTDKDLKVANYAQALTILVTQADALKKELDRLDSLDTSEEIKGLKLELEVFEKSLVDFDLKVAKPPTVEQQLNDNEEYQAKIIELTKLKHDAPEEPKVDIADLQHDKVVLEDEIRVLERELAKEGIIKQSKERVSVLENEEKRLASEMAFLEGQEFTIEAFNRKKVEEVENRVNGLFEHVKFKMFD